MFNPETDLLDPLPSKEEADWGLLPSPLSTASLEDGEEEEWEDEDTDGERGRFDDDDDWGSGCDVNPASGLPMMGDSCIDICGNPFGTSSDD